MIKSQSMWSVGGIEKKYISTKIEGKSMFIAVKKIKKPVAPVRLKARMLAQS